MRKGDRSRVPQPLMELRGLYPVRDKVPFEEGTERGTGTVFAAKTAPVPSRRLPNGERVFRFGHRRVYEKE